MYFSTVLRGHFVLRHIVPVTYCPGDILSQLKEVDILSQDTLATRVHQNIKKFSKFHSNLIYVVSI